MQLSICIIAADLQRNHSCKFFLQKARQAAEDAEETMKRHAAILPEQVLKENNTNLFFSSINDGDELLQLRSENYYALVDVGDLHVIRIARFQCNYTTTPVTETKIGYMPIETDLSIARYRQR